MSSMSRKNYAGIAEALIAGVKDFHVQFATVQPKNQQEVRRLIVGCVGGKLAVYFKNDNDRFNVNKFIDYLDTLTNEQLDKLS